MLQPLNKLRTALDAESEEFGEVLEALEQLRTSCADNKDHKTVAGSNGALDLVAQVAAAGSGEASVTKASYTAMRTLISKHGTACGPWRPCMNQCVDMMLCDQLKTASWCLNPSSKPWLPQSWQPPTTTSSLQRHWGWQRRCASVRKPTSASCTTPVWQRQQSASSAHM